MIIYRHPCRGSETLSLMIAKTDLKFTSLMLWGCIQPGLWFMRCKKLCLADKVGWWKLHIVLFAPSAECPSCADRTTFQKKCTSYCVIGQKFEGVLVWGKMTAGCWSHFFWLRSCMPRLLENTANCSSKTFRDSKRTHMSCSGRVYQDFSPVVYIWVWIVHMKKTHKVSQSCHQWLVSHALLRKTKQYLPR